MDAEREAVIGRESRSPVGILGYGEVGQAIAQLYDSSKIKDLVRDDGLEDISVLNICIPWSEEFVNIVDGVINGVRKLQLVIVHSTVVVGTTKLLQEMHPSLAIVHSPVRGMHPFLLPNLRTFVKYVGAESEYARDSACQHLASLEIVTEGFIPAATTELGKLLSTTYYGLCIAWHGEMQKLCCRAGVSFDEAVTAFNCTYNKGYVRLGKQNVIRPVLCSPDGGIGGHCIIPNARLLARDTKSLALDLILQYTSEL